MVRRVAPKVAGWLIPLASEQHAKTPIFTDSGTCQNIADNVPESDVPELCSATKNDVPEAGVPELDDAGDVPEVVKGWRVEVTHNGRYYHWRKGSHANRQTKNGGRFEQLSAEQKANYERNRQTYHNRIGH